MPVFVLTYKVFITLQNANAWGLLFIGPLCMTYPDECHYRRSSAIAHLAKSIIVEKNPCVS